MKSKATGTLSGCIVWIISFGMISLCILPIAMIIGGATSVSNFAMQRLAPVICPEGTTAESYSYASTTTAYEMHCVDASGTVVKKDPVLYGFLWIGIIAVIGLVIAALLAFTLAAPAGVLITKLLNRRQKQDIFSKS